MTDVLRTQTIGTANTGVLKTYPCCACCAESNCDRFEDKVVTCPECKASCSCEGCVTDYLHAEEPTTYAVRLKTAIDRQET